MASIFTSTSLHFPGYLLLLLLTIGYLSRSTEGIECYKCNYDGNRSHPMDCPIHKGKTTCGGADGCITIHHEVFQSENGHQVNGYRAGLGGCLEHETKKCIEDVIGIKLNPVKDVPPNTQCQTHNYAPDAEDKMLKVLKCMGRDLTKRGTNETSWDITANFCPCFKNLCNGEAPKAPPAPPSKGKATRNLFGGWAVMIWTALAAGLMRGVQTS